MYTCIYIYIFELIDQSIRIIESTHSNQPVNFNCGNIPHKETAAWSLEEALKRLHPSHASLTCTAHVCRPHGSRLRACGRRFINK